MTAGPGSSGLMVCGTTSNSGKTTVVAGLCRLMARRGLRVAPFKAQNMANNSAATASGHEIGRAQAWQAYAAGVEPEVAMNPILLKPTGPARSQVVLMGRPLGDVAAADYHRRKPEFLTEVLAALADLRSRHDLVILEGAGSPAEINLLDRDIVNLRIAREAGLPAIVVGDIDLGGVWAALYGTVALLPPEYRSLVKGFVVNKFRGDPTLLGDAGPKLEARCGVPTIGVVPYLTGPVFDGEDAVLLERPAAALLERPDAAAGPEAPASGDLIDVAVVRFPHIANFTDLDPLTIEPSVRVRFVEDVAALGRPDLVILPGSKSTVADLRWLTSRGLAGEIAESPATVLGICAGYQMLGRRIEDPAGAEATAGTTVDGVGLLAATTRFEGTKVTRLRSGSSAEGWRVSGYQIHHGRVSAAAPWLHLAGTPDGTVGKNDAGAKVYGTTLHGIFESDEFRRRFLAGVAERVGKRFVSSSGLSFAQARDAAIDRIADAIEANVDMKAIDRIIGGGAGGVR